MCVRVSVQLPELVGMRVGICWRQRSLCDCLIGLYMVRLSLQFVYFILNGHNNNAIIIIIIHIQLL